jgi:hypothetical protein
MEKLFKGKKTEKIKKDILKGRQHLTHYSGKLIKARKQIPILNCV